MRAASRAVFAAICFASAMYGQTAPIMTWEEYAKLREFPHTLRLRTAGGELLYYAVRHTRDPKDPQLAEIEALWREFRPTVAMSEGGVRPAAGSPRDAVERYGEPGFLRLLADRARVPIQSLEAPREVEITAMLQIYPAERLKLFYFLRTLADRRTVTEGAQEELDYWSRGPGLGGLPRSVEDVDRAVPNWREVSESWFNPLRDDAFTNEVTRVLSRYRDEQMVKTLAAAVRRGERVFAVVGSTHLAMQERALRALVR